MAGGGSRGSQVAASLPLLILYLSKKMKLSIKRNLIKSRIHLHCKGDLDLVEVLMLKLQTTLFPNQSKTWTRILNNYSQPTLTQAASIAKLLKLPIDGLFEFEELETAEI